MTCHLAVDREKELKTMPKSDMHSSFRHVIHCINITELNLLTLNKYIKSTGSGFSPEIFEGVVAFSGIVKLGSITNVTGSAT